MYAGKWGAYPLNYCSIQYRGADMAGGIGYDLYIHDGVDPHLAEDPSEFFESADGRKIRMVLGLLIFRRYVENA